MDYACIWDKKIKIKKKRQNLNVAHLKTYNQSESSKLCVSHLVSVGSTRTLSYTLYLTPFLASDSRTAFTGGRRDKFLSVIRQTFWAPRFWRSCRRTGQQQKLYLLCRIMKTDESTFVFHTEGAENTNLKKHFHRQFFVIWFVYLFNLWNEVMPLAVIKVKVSYFTSTVQLWSRFSVFLPWSYKNTETLITL